MGIAPKFEQLQQLTDEQVRERYDQATQHTVIGTSFYLDELRHRDYEHIMKATNDLARRIFWLGVMNSVSAFVAAVAATIALAT